MPACRPMPRNITVFPSKAAHYGLSQTPWLRILAITPFLLATACGNSKLIQCNQLIEQINNTEQTLSNITRSSPPDIDALEDISKATNQAFNTLEEVELSSRELKRYKNRFIEFYQKISEDSQNIVDSHRDQNMLEAEAAYTNLKTTFQTQEDLVNELNKFCSENYQNTDNSAARPLQDQEFSIVTQLFI